jgi:hypothetical protein
MVEVVSLLVVLMMTLIITRVATVALTLTGMSQPAARFQARSALTGAGFTTSESERAVNHPVRRRVIMALMLIGNTGLVLVASLMVAVFLGGREQGFADRWRELLILLGGLSVLYLIARSRWVERAMGRLIQRVLERNADIGQRDYASLLRLSGEYRVVEMSVAEGDWLAGKSLRALDLNREGVLVLGVTRADGGYVGAPRGETDVAAGDVLLVYGRESTLAQLDQRRAGVGGHLEHVESVVRAGRRDEQDEDEPAEGADASRPEAD